MDLAMSVRDRERTAKPGVCVRLFTSSYGAWRPELGAPVVTSLTTPKWLPEAASWPRLWPVTPRWSYFHASEQEFDRQYIAQLDRYGAQQIARRMTQIARSGFAEPADRLVLLCWEIQAARCHRGLFSSWWLAQTGERMTETTWED
jgi:hypothetical protein